MTDHDERGVALLLRTRLQDLVAGVEPAPDALNRILAELPADEVDVDAAVAVSLVVDGIAPARRRRRWLPVAAAGGIAAALAVGIGWAVVAGQDASSTQRGPAGASPAPATTDLPTTGPTPDAADTSAATAAAAIQAQAAFAACAAAGVAAIEADGGAAPGSTVLTGPATGWTAGAHVEGTGGEITIGTAPGGELASCSGPGYQYLGVLGGPAGALASVAVPATGRAAQLVADNTAAQQGVNLQAGVLAPDVTRMTVTAAPGVTVQAQVVGHTYALIVGPVPGTTTLADATMHLFDAAGTETWSGPVE